MLSLYVVGLLLAAGTAALLSPDAAPPRPRSPA